MHATLYTYQGKIIATFLNVLACLAIFIAFSGSPIEVLLLFCAPFIGVQITSFMYSEDDVLDLLQVHCIFIVSYALCFYFYGYSPAAPAPSGLEATHPYSEIVRNYVGFTAIFMAHSIYLIIMFLRGLYIRSHPDAKNRSSRRSV